MQLMPVFEIVESSKLYERLPTLRSFSPTKRLALRTVLVLLTATGALVVPKFGLFINLIGAFACTALAFILPVQMYNKSHKDTLSKKWKWIHTILVAFGCICGTISFIISIVEIVKAFSEEDQIPSEQIANPAENNVITEIDLNHHTQPSSGTVPLTPNGLRLL